MRLFQIALYPIFYSTVHLIFYFMYQYLFSDGLIDCQDPDCCYRSECLNHHLCLTMDDPKDILRHNNASKSYVFTRSSGTSSFWERIRFLVMPEKGVQRYAQISHFDPKQVFLSYHYYFDIIIKYKLCESKFSFIFVYFQDCMRYSRQSSNFQNGSFNRSSGISRKSFGRRIYIDQT